MENTNKPIFDDTWIPVRNGLPNKSCWCWLKDLDEPVWFDKADDKFKRNPLSIISYHSVSYYKIANLKFQSI